MPITDKEVEDENARHPREPEKYAPVIPGPRIDEYYRKRGYTDDDAYEDWRDRTR